MIIENATQVPKSLAEIGDTADITILQPEGVNIHLGGPVNNLRVDFASPQGGFSYNDKAGEEVKFYLSEPDLTLGSRYFHYQYALKRIGLPLNGTLVNNTSLALAHEIGHHRSLSRIYWRKRMGMARSFFSQDQPFLDRGWELSDDPKLRDQQRDALAVMILEERNAYAYAVKFVRAGRRNGIDPTPHLRQLKDIQGEIRSDIAYRAFPEIGVYSEARRRNGLGWLFKRYHGVQNVYVEPWDEFIRYKTKRKTIETGLGMVALGLLLLLGNEAIIQQQPLPQTEINHLRILELLELVIAPILYRKVMYHPETLNPLLKLLGSR